jgi:phage gpG-like protein
MGFTLSVKVDGEQVISKILRNVSDLPNDLREPFKRVRSVVIGAISKNFLAEGRDEAWAPLADRTVRDRLSQGFGAGPIGVRTGDMAHSLTGDGPNTVNIIEEQRAEFGAMGIKEAVFHRGRDGQSARPVLYLDEDDKKAIVYEFRKEVKNMITKSASEFFGGK